MPFIPNKGKYIVSHERRFVYVITPKVACSSIKTALAPLFGLSTDGLIREDGRSRIHRVFDDSPHVRRKRRFIREMREGTYDGYFIFSFVRNPFDRLVSCWRQKLAPGAAGLGNLDYNGVELCMDMSFSEFVEAIHRIPDDIANHHFRSQHIPLSKPNGTKIPQFIGRFEQLAEDFREVADRIGADHSLPHVLSSSADNHYREYYDTRTRRLATERYERDLELFSYEW